MNDEDVGLVGRLGPIEIDWPRTLGYYGGVAAAVAFGVVEAPLGAVIAVAPFARMLDFPGARRARRLAGQVLEGAVKPIGGEDEGTLRLTPGAQRRQSSSQSRLKSAGANRRRAPRTASQADDLSSQNARHRPVRRTRPDKG